MTTLTRAEEENRRSIITTGRAAGKSWNVIAEELGLVRSAASDWARRNMAELPTRHQGVRVIRRPGHPVVRYASVGWCLVCPRCGRNPVRIYRNHDHACRARDLHDRCCSGSERDAFTYVNPNRHNERQDR